MRRFVKERHDSCTICSRAFSPGDRNHLGRDKYRKTQYVGDCCSSKLISTVIRHIHQPRAYQIPNNDAILWRFLDFTKFVSMLKERTLFFTRADQFADPFEGAKGLLKNKHTWDAFYLGFFAGAISNPPEGMVCEKSADEIAVDAKRLLNDMDRGGQRDMETTYINCWHENSYESEAMWKLYTSAQDQGIAIRTTFDRLYRSLGRNPDIDIGRVSYIDFENRFVGINESFWYKRRSFEHEREVRAIVRSRNQESGLGIHQPTDLTKLVSRVHVSPMSPRWFKDLDIDVMKIYGLKKRVFASEMLVVPFR
jgi:hypothetical protein